MSSEAIIAKLGLDTKDFQKDLNGSVAQVLKAHTQMMRASKGQQSTTDRLGTSIRSAGREWARAGIAAITGPLLSVVAIGSLIEGVKVVKELQRELGKVSNLGRGRFASIDELKAGIQESIALIEKADQHLGSWYSRSMANLKDTASAVWEGITNPKAAFAGTIQVEGTNKSIEALREREHQRRLDNEKTLAQKEQDRLAVARMALSISEKESALKAAENKRSEGLKQRSQINNPEAVAQHVANVEKQYQLEIEQIEKKARLAQNEIDLEIRKSELIGSNAEKAIAAKRLEIEMIEKALDLGGPEEEQAKLKARLASSKTEESLLVQQKAINDEVHAAEIKARKEIASFRGSEGDKAVSDARAQLEIDKARLAALQKHSPKETAQIESAQASVKEGERRVELAEKARNIAKASLEDELAAAKHLAGFRGTADEMAVEARRSELDLVNRQIEALNPNDADDGDQIKQLQIQQAQAARAFDDAKKQERLNRTMLEAELSMREKLARFTGSEAERNLVSLDMEIAMLQEKAALLEDMFPHDKQAIREIQVQVTEKKKQQADSAAEQAQKTPQEIANERNEARLAESRRRAAVQNQKNREENARLNSSGYRDSVFNQAKSPESLSGEIAKNQKKNPLTLPSMRKGAAKNEGAAGAPEAGADPLALIKPVEGMNPITKQALAGVPGFGASPSKPDNGIEAKLDKLYTLIDQRLGVNR